MLRQKYGAQPVTIDGLRFASKREAARYLDLRYDEKRGKISGLELQVRYPLVVGDVKIADYLADFRYTRDGEVIVEDVKGVRTPVYRLKKKLLKALYGIEILET